MRHSSCAAVVFAAVTSVVLSSTALAGPCPDDFNFVDFGQQVTTGGIAPGGPVVKVVSDGRTLLRRPPSCQTISGDASLLADDTGAPIPLVNAIGYDPSVIAPNLDRVGVTRVSGQAHILAAMVDPLREPLQNNPDVNRTTGAGLMCYSLAYPVFPSVVCDLDNPFDTSEPISMSCEEGRCNITQITMSADLIASADWHAASGHYGTPHDAERDAVAILSAIHDFLTGQRID